MHCKRATFAALAAIVLMLGTTAFASPIPLRYVPDIGACLGSFDYERTVCLEHVFTSIVRAESAAAAHSYAGVLKRAGIADDCHVLMHAVGHANLDKYGGDLGAALASCPLGCYEGCYHGAVEQYAAYMGTNAFIAAIPDLCAPTSSLTHIERRQCLHGIGHGLVRHGVRDPQDAIRTCGQLGTKFEQDTCIGGVMMEYINSHIDGGTFLENLEDMCTLFAHDDTLLYRCIDNVGWGLMVYTGHNLEQSLSYCEKIPEMWREPCRRAVEGERDLNAHEIAL